MAAQPRDDSLAPLREIETIVYVMMENRSFDHLLGHLSLAGPLPPMEVEGLRDDAAWRKAYANAYNGTLYPPHELDPSTQFIDDPPHEWQNISVQIETPRPDAHGSQLGGFVKSYAQGYSDPAKPRDRSLVMGYYPARAAPVYDFFARNYVVCDHWFSSLPAGTQPNRLMAMSGESLIANNQSVFLPDQPLVYDWLEAHDVSWCVYQCGNFFPFFTLMKKWSSEIVTSLTLQQSPGRFRRYDDFPAAWVGGGTLPRVIFIEPEYTDGPQWEPNDDHSPTGIAAGQAFMANIYRVLISNPERWARTLLVVTYDEHGGFFDHVQPLPIQARCGGHGFRTTGLRVPAFLVSPRVPAGVPFTGALDHTSFLQLIADRFNPGQSYSSPVGVRQSQLAQLASALQPAERSGSPVPIPQATLDAVEAARVHNESPVQRLLGADELPNVLAFHNAAKALGRSHGELLKHPAWTHVNRYLGDQEEVYA